MGVINVTPDSFSDGGVHLRVDAAVTAAWGMLDAGAAIVDVGGESTRPGSDGVKADEELAPVEPVLTDLGGAPLSIDTSKAASPAARSSSASSSSTTSPRFEATPSWQASSPSAAAISA